MTPQQQLADRLYELLPHKKELFEDGNLVQFECYTCHINEREEKMFTDKPDKFVRGVILENVVYGASVVSDYGPYGLRKEHFKDGVWVTGVDENGVIDVYEYCKAEVIKPKLCLADLLMAIEKTTYRYSFTHDMDGTMLYAYDFNEPIGYAPYNLSKDNILDQSDELCLLALDLLK